MDNELFLKRLSEVSEWSRPQTGPKGHPAVCKGRVKKIPEHPGVLTEAQLDEMSDDQVETYYEQLMAWREAQPNESIGPEITSIKCQPKDCEDCGQHCPNGRRTERKLHESGSKHWRERCVECDMFKEPLTGQFTLTKQRAHQYFLDFYKPKLGKYKSKYQPAPKAPKAVAPKPPKIKPTVTPQQAREEIKKYGYWEIDSGDSIIRGYKSEKDQ